jgi:hypothetical protein
MSVEHFGQLAAFVNDEVRCWHDAQTVLHDRIDFTRTEISGDCKLEMQQHIEIFHSGPYSGSNPGDWQDTAHAPKTPLADAHCVGQPCSGEGESFHDIAEEGNKNNDDELYYQTIDNEVNKWEWFDKQLFLLYLRSGKSMREIQKETGISLKIIFYPIKKCKLKLNGKVERIRRHNCESNEVY